MDFSKLMRSAMGASQNAAAYDSAKKDKAPEREVDASGYVERDISLRAINALAEWLETDDLDEGEGLADRLLAMLVGIADENQDEELDGAEIAVLETAANAVGDFMELNGVDAEDIDILLNDWDDDVAERVRDLLASVMPDGEDEVQQAIDAFVFTDGDQDAVFDATYKKAFAVRKGKKTRINKRVSGKVRLSGKQKMALKKARMKSHSAKAQLGRAKSMRVRKRSSL